MTTLSSKKTPLITLLTLILAMPAGAFADPAVDRLLASQCAQCHGTNGQAVGDMDSLAGEGFEELYEELLEMKYDDDPNEIMHRQARGYWDDQLRRIAQYYAGRPDAGGDRDDVRGSDDDHDDDHEHRPRGGGDDDDHEDED